MPHMAKRTARNRVRRYGSARSRGTWHSRVATRPSRSIDSIEEYQPPIRHKLAADIARIALALPGDTAALFRGLPFVVNKAWRARLTNGQTLLAAVVVRNVNQEANPRQERIFFIAERDSAATARFTPRYTERTIVLRNAQTTIRLPWSCSASIAIPLIFIATPAMACPTRSLNVSPGQWQRRWASTYAGC